MASVPKELIPQKHLHQPSASSASLAKSESSAARSNRAAASTIKHVVTAPPWARDEPPSPTDEASPGLLSPSLTRRPSDPRPSDVTSFRSSQTTDTAPSRWWTFASQQPGPSAPAPAAPAVDQDDDDRTPTASGGLRSFVGLALKERSRSWLQGSTAAGNAGGMRSARGSVDGGSMATPRGELKGKGRERSDSFSRGRPVEMDRGLTIRLPATPAQPHTIHHAQTPGWASPWTPRVGGSRPGDDYWTLGNGHGESGDGSGHSSDKEKATGWAKQRKNIRSYLLNNVYVPLLFRFVNLTFSAAALAMAIQIRALEKKHGILGAIGSSPILVIIFAPVTLTHVMAAVYLEYFGRPLGLWHTSHKLAHTLFEVLFICAWSAALALAFDNYYTSYLPCAPRSEIDWFSQLPRPELPDVANDVAEHICDDQLILISLVFIGLIMYCTNLVISLFRIFEKVKYHSKHGTRL